VFSFLAAKPLLLLAIQFGNTNTMSKMNLRFTAAVSVAALLAWKVSAAQDAPRDWENPQLTGLNNERPHATMVVCPDAATARGIGEEHRDSVTPLRRGQVGLAYGAGQGRDARQAWRTRTSARQSSLTGP